MFEGIMAFFSPIIANFRIQDLFDILIIGSLIYVLLIWFKNTTSRFVFVGIILLGAIYFLARLFNLYLTSMLLQGFFAILLIALVVIFQEEIRRFFERLATWGTLRKAKSSDGAGPYHLDMEIIVESVAELAENKTGALIVLQGKDPLDRHLKGGYGLDGSLSQPLLASIFDTHSAGHDGAVVIDKGRIMKFGCHLPLSSDVNVSGKLGLRHTAGLGLSEKSDALCIIVSEERGTITVARQGRLEQVESSAELTGILEQFYERSTPEGRAGLFSHWLRENTPEKAVAILLAMVLWFAFGYQRDWIQRDFTVPIEYRNIPSEWYVEEPKISQAKVALSGSVQAFNLFNPSTLKISFDLSGIEEGYQEIMITKNMIRVPSNLSVTKFSPTRIKLTAYRLHTMNLPVHVNTTGQLPDKLVLKNILITPGTVKVLVPSKFLKRNITVHTTEVDLSGISETYTFEPKLLFPPEIRFIDDIPPEVTVTIQVAREEREKREG